MAAGNANLQKQSERAMSNPFNLEQTAETMSSQAWARREFLRKAGTGAAALGLMSFTGTAVLAANMKANPDMANGADNFYKSDKVTLQKVAFKDQYQMNVAGNLFVPKALDRSKAHPALVVSHPMGAVKEQSANLYATKMAEQGFVALAIDLPGWGESEGPRNLVSPEMYAEAFSAAVDFLGTRPFVDRSRIGAIGICGSGSFAISAAKIDPRMKAIATVSMYDMGAVNRDALQKSMTLEQRKAVIAAAAEQRYVEFQGGEVAVAGGTDLQLTAQTHPIQREFYDFYRTPRGEFTPAGASPLRTTKPTVASNVKFMNFYPFNDIETISPRPLLFISGDQAHSKEFSEDAYRRAAEPKELVWVRGAGHVDLYDRVNLIPWDKLTSFFGRHLAQTVAL
ncbi:fermentation-respiration switch protein FrsA (DUF1100 family) [Variovorax sp. 3319]|nr:fermentation-respiration switch protein FrsA (DUF1100 family) [Variovorax sp. 3319]